MSFIKKIKSLSNIHKVENYFYEVEACSMDRRASCDWRIRSESCMTDELFSPLMCLELNTGMNSESRILELRPNPTSNPTSHMTRRVSRPEPAEGLRADLQ